MEWIRESLDASQFAWWDWDIVRNRVLCNDLKYTMLGYAPSSFQDAGYEQFTRLLHPDDYDRTMQAMRDHLEERAPIYQVDYRIRRADGTTTWYMDRGAVIEKSADGKPMRLRGLVLDLGEEMDQSAADRILVQAARGTLPRPGDPDAVVELCMVCRKLRASPALWTTVDESFRDAFPESVSHGLCPACLRKLYPGRADGILRS